MTLGDLGVLGEKDIGRIITDKFADLMLPEKERLSELEFMINQAHDKFSNLPLKDILRKMGWDEGRIKELLQSMLFQMYGYVQARYAPEKLVDITETDKEMVRGLVKSAIKELHNMVK